MTSASVELVAFVSFISAIALQKDKGKKITLFGYGPQGGAALDFNITLFLLLLRLMSFHPPVEDLDFLAFLALALQLQTIW